MYLKSLVELLENSRCLINGCAYYSWLIINFLNLKIKMPTDRIVRKYQQYFVPSSHAVPVTQEVMAVTFRLPFSDL